MRKEVEAHGGRLAELNGRKAGKDELVALSAKLGGLSSEFGDSLKKQMQVGTLVHEYSTIIYENCYKSRYFSAYTCL